MIAIISLLSKSIHEYRQTAGPSSFLILLDSLSEESLSQDSQPPLSTTRASTSFDAARQSTRCCWEIPDKSRPDTDFSIISRSSVKIPHLVLSVPLSSCVYRRSPLRSDISSTLIMANHSHPDRRAVEKKVEQECWTMFNIAGYRLRITFVDCHSPIIERIARLKSSSSSSRSDPPLGFLANH